MTLEGQQLGRYRIIRLLGSGGMGDVYLAEDPRILQQVAIKVIRSEGGLYPDTARAETAERLFQREAQAIVALDHLHILPLYDFAEEPRGKTRLIYLVMPYRPEGSLVDWVQQRYPDRLVPPAVVAHIVKQAAWALQHAHEHEIVHADVKPSNFLIRSNPTEPDTPDLFLSDFGLALIATSTKNSSQTIRGTPTYMAPEQCDGEAVPASDQYALAVMAYELLTGQPPFQGVPLRLMYHHVHTAPLPPSAHNPHLSSVVDDVLLKALSKRPTERFRSATAFAAAFDTAVQASGQVGATTRSIKPPLPKITAVLPAIPSGGDVLEETPSHDTPAGMKESPNRPAQPDLSAITSGWPAGTFDWEGGTRGSGSLTAPPRPSAHHSSEGRRRRSGAVRLVWITTTGLFLLAVALGGAAIALPGLFSSRATPGAAAGQKPSPTTPASATNQAIAATRTPASATTSVPPGATPHPPPPGSALVIITPASQTVSNTFIITAVTGTPNSQQVQARQLSANVGPYTQTVNATGQKSVPGTQASGGLLLVNHGTTSVTFTAGTSYPNNHSCAPSPPNVDLVLDATVTLPPNTSGNPNTPTTANAPGHVLEVGSIGNFPYGGNNGCVNFDWWGPSCPSDCWQVVNSSDFTGGQDPYNVTVVQQSDIDNAANALEAANQPDAQQALQGQVLSNERLVGAQCAPQVSSNYNAGDQAIQVTVSVLYTCSGETYDDTGAMALAAALLANQAANNPGSGYALVGQILGNVINATPGGSTVTLTVNAYGVWAYQFSASRLQALAQLIAGTTIQQAQQVLTSQQGVAQASVQVGGGNGMQLPSDPSAIQFVVQSVSGA